MLILDYWFGGVTTKRVKNLGWLLRNWSRLTRFDVLHAAKPGLSTLSDCYLVATLDNGNVVAMCSFADSGVLYNWLIRPVFYDVPVNWFGQELRIRKGGF